MRFKCVILIVLLAFLFGCAATTYEGRRIDPMKVKQLEPGETALAKVEKDFGKPDRIERMSSGEEHYIYLYKRNNPYWWTMDSLDGQNLDIVIKDGIVRTYKFREEGKEVFLKD